VVKSFDLSARFGATPPPPPPPGAGLFFSPPQSPGGGGLIVFGGGGREAQGFALRGLSRPCAAKLPNTRVGALPRAQSHDTEMKTAPGSRP